MPPEWIEPAEGFRIILRAKRPSNPVVADQIISTDWFLFPEMQAKKHSPADFEAAEEAFHVFRSEYRAGRIRSRGILNRAAPIDIDPTDAKAGSLDLFARRLDCSSVVRGRVFRNVFVDKASVRRVTARTVASLATSAKYIPKFVRDYIEKNPKTASLSGARNAWKDAGHGASYRDELDAEYRTRAEPKGLLRN